MCYCTLISLIPPSKHFSCPSIFWGMWMCLQVVPRSGLFLWTPPSSVQGSAAWQHSTVKDLIYKAGEEFRDKSLYLELHAERDWKPVQAPKGCSRADLGNPEGRSQGHRQQRSHVRGLVFMSTLYWTERDHRPHRVCWKSIIFWYCWYFSMFLVLKTWTDNEGRAIRKRPVGMCHCVGPFPCLFTDTKEGNLAGVWH